MPYVPLKSKSKTYTRRLHLIRVTYVTTFGRRERDRDERDKEREKERQKERKRKR